MKIGDEHILVNERPYSIWFENYHNKIAPKFIKIKIIKRRENVLGEFSGKICGEGFLAKGSDGYMYEYNYIRYHEGYGIRGWSRYITDEDFEKLSEKDALIEDYLWHDITNFQCPAKPKIIEKFDVGIEFCEVHQKIFYERTGCLNCKHAPVKRFQTKLNMHEHSWIGWY